MLTFLLLAGGVVAQVGTGVYVALGWATSLLVSIALWTMCGERYGNSSTVEKTRQLRRGKGKVNDKADDEKQRDSWPPLVTVEMLQVVLSIIPPVLLLFPIVDVVLHAMSHTLADGSSALLGEWFPP